MKESPQFTEAHVSLSLVYYRLKRPEDSKREREMVLKLTAQAQAKQPGAKFSDGRARKTSGLKRYSPQVKSVSAKTGDFLLAV